jgi:hypothetical protein
MDTLLQQMDRHRGEFVCVFTGQPEQMAALFAGYPTLRGLMPKVITLPDFTSDQLREIFGRLADRHGFTLTPEAADVIDAMLAMESALPGFANAQTVEQLFNAAVVHHATRLAAVPNTPSTAELTTFTAADIRW